MNGPRYTVLTYIIGDYEQVHEIKERSERATYLLITDNPNLKSKTWRVIHDFTMTGGPFNKVMDIRWNPWRYTNDEIVITLDGSLGVNSSLDELVDAFDAGNHELGIVIHPHRNTAAAELDVWTSFRKHEGASRQFSFLIDIDYGLFTYKGLYQTGFMIRRRTDSVMSFGNMVDTRLLVCGKGERDRLDQVLASAILNLQFSNMSVLWFSERLLESKFITWYGHGSNDVVHQTDLIEPYAFNHPVDVFI